MNRPRIMPVMLVENRRAVKTKRFSHPVYIGDPVNTTRIFSEKGVDELIVLEISSRPVSKILDFEFISRIAEEAFMPLAVGGGITTSSDAKKLFDLGIEKVILGWEGSDSLRLVSEIADIYGVQAVAVCVDVSRDKRLSKQCHKNKKYVEHSSASVSVLRQIQDSGGGEVILQSVDFDGMMNGMDYELIEEVSKSISAPIVALGGAGCLEHLVRALDCGANAVASGSTFVFHNSDRAVLLNYPTDIEIQLSFEKLNRT
jgi:cyclase